MPRRRLRDWPIRVYTYGARLGPAACRERWPVAVAQVVEAQHALWNQLVACFERHREHYETLLQAQEALAPLRVAMEATQAQYSASQQAENAARQRYRRTRHPEATTLRRAVAEAHQHARAARQAYRAAVAAHRDQLRPQHTALLDRLWAEAESLSKAAPLAWYNQRLISDSFRRAVERFLRRQGGPPQRKHAITQAHLTYHFSGAPLTWERLLGGKTSIVQISPLPAWVWDETRAQSVRRKAARTTVTLRISDTDSLTFRVTVMRRPPPGASIRSAELVGREVVRRWGQAHSRWDWAFALVCEIPPETIPRRAPLRQAALDLRWRVLDDQTIRVGMLWDGTHYTALHFPTHLRARWRHVQEVHRQVAEVLTACKARLETVWQDTPLPADLLSEPWAQVSQRGLLRLLRAVQALPAGVPSRAATLAVLEPWERRTGKLWREARGLQGHLARAKQAWYRVIAKELCTKYDVRAIEDLNLRQISQQRPAISPRLQASMAYRQLVAPGAFLQRLAHTAAREGVHVIKVDATYSTLTCPVCEAVLPSQDGQLWLTCPQGHRYDQDRGAALTLFRRAFARGEHDSSEGKTS